MKGYFSLILVIITTVVVIFGHKLYLAVDSNLKLTTTIAETVHEHTERLDELSSVVEKIKSEQKKRTAHVYKVPLIEENLRPDTSPVIAIMNIDKDGTITACSRGIYSLTGWEPRDVVTNDFGIFMTSQTRNNHNEFLKSSFDEVGIINCSTVDILDVDGQMVTVDLSVIKINDGYVATIKGVSKNG